MAGIKLNPGARVVFFGAFTPSADAVVLTLSSSSSALPGIDGGSVKITPLAEYPAKGRATGGVRCHRFRSGEDLITLAWVGNGPVRAASASGVPAELPSEPGKRDAAGIPLTSPVSSVGGRL
jgi:DNA gyrase subunit A